MKLIRQLDYPDVPYRTNTDHPEDIEGLTSTVSDSGCGLCAAMMMVEYLIPQVSFSLRDAIELSYESKSNHGIGTDYNRYTKALCDRFHLSVERTDKKEVLVQALKNGKCAIVNVGGDREGYLGVFSKYGHFIVVLSEEDSRVKVLDPGYRKEKYEESHRNVCSVKEPYIYAAIDVLMKDCENRKNPIYLFGKE